MISRFGGTEARIRLPDGARPLLRTIKRHKVMLGAPLMLALGFGWVLTQYLPRQYTAEAILALDVRRVQIVSSEVVSRLPQENAALRTELDILASRGLAEHVVDQLGLASDPATLREVAADQSVVGVIGRAIADLAAGRFGHQGVGSASLDEKTTSDAATVPPSRADVVDWVVSRVKATNDSRSFTMFVAFTAGSPASAARIANALAQTYLDEQVNRKEAMTSRASARLAAKLGEMRQAAATADATVTEFRHSAGLMETKGVTVAAQQLSELNTQLGLARAERARAEGKLEMARKGSANSLPDVLASQTVQTLRTELARAEVKLRENARNLFQLSDLQVTVDSFRKQVELETQRVADSLLHDLTAARARETNLEASLERLRGDYGQASTKLVELNQLQREADASRVIYESFLARYKQTIEQKGLDVPDAVLITQAQSPALPVSPKTFPIMLIAGLSGVLIGGVGLVLRERLDDRVHDIRQLDVFTGTPVLGVLPDLSRGGWLASRSQRARHPGARVAVALQWLRVALLRLRAKRRTQVVLVTSAMAGEGKTSLCVSLACELSRSGERVLVIDADTYRPQVATAFSKSGMDGGDREQDTHRGLVQIDALSGVHFFAALEPKQFQRLLGDGSIARLLRWARNDYDVIILDTTPTLAGADAALLGQLVDVRLFVVRCGWTTWDGMLASLASLRLCGAAVDGLVVVNGDSRDLGSYGSAPAVSERPGPLLVGHKAV